MNLTRTALTVASAAAMAATSLVAASPAAAEGLSAGCSYLNELATFADDDLIVGVDAGLDFHPGEVVTVAAARVSGPGLGARVDVVRDSATLVTLTYGPLPSSVAYTVQESTADDLEFLVDGNGVFTWDFSCSSAGQGPDLTPWLQAYARATGDQRCESGWNPSYAGWVNGGIGGWTCERTVLRYG